MATTDASALSDDLKALLNANDVSKVIQDEIAKQGYFTTEAFANSVDYAKEVIGFVSPTTLKDDKPAFALLKQAWKEADATVTRGIKRMAEGLADTILDEALPDTTQTLINQNFVARYAWNLEFKLRPCDTLLGRIRREFEKGIPTMYQIVKVNLIFSNPGRRSPRDTVLTSIRPSSSTMIWWNQLPP